MSLKVEIKIIHSRDTLIHYSSGFRVICTVSALSASRVKPGVVSLATDRYGDFGRVFGVLRVHLTECGSDCGVFYFDHLRELTL